MTDLTLHNRMANAVRALAIDAVEAAKSGHPGLPMGMADAATVLYTRFLKFDPAAPAWPDRDRFVLSAGHGSMLLYAILHLIGVEDMPMEQIRRFRQLGSRTAGHPEHAFAGGIETTTGPLGQGLGNAVGMAVTERILAARFGADLVDHRTYVIASDGDLMEGISHEAASLAGHLRLSKLTVLFDDNGISIDGPTSLTESTDQTERFQAYGWRTERVDGHDPEQVAAALERAAESDRPSFIACRTVIGFGAPKKAGTAAVHGSPLGRDEAEAAKRNLGWTLPPFEIPEDLYAAWRKPFERARAARQAWEARLEAADPALRREFERRLKGELAPDLDEAIRALKGRLVAEAKPMATRKSSELALEAVNGALPETVGGSADLTGSNNTKTKNFPEIAPDNFSGRYIHYGVREHGMAAAMNGMALHGGVIPYGGTFLVFSDYCRPSVRLSALMGQRVIYVFTHDSIGLGEDGPTHQPVEQLAALRAIPNLAVMRPADAVETAECWQAALETRSGPSALALTRQDVPLLRRDGGQENLAARGAYDISPAEDADAVIFATGSEVSLAVEAKRMIADAGFRARVVSVPCFERFWLQDAAYRARILGRERVRVAVEAAVRMGWDPFIGPDGLFVGMERFGASGPYQAVYEHFGITAEAVAQAAISRLREAAA
jgi:transketolase